MKAYINKETKSLVVYTNFIPSDISNLIELTDAQYREYQEKTKQGYKANININNDVVDITYIENKKKTYIKELQEIKKWFNTYYTEHEQKYNRLIALNKTLDDGTSPQDALNSLYSQAEGKRKQYQDLETELSHV